MISVSSKTIASSVAGAALGLALLTPIAAAAQSAGHKTAAPSNILVSGICAPTTSKFVVATGVVSTNLTTFVTVPNTTINFVQGGTKPGCIMVSFSADAKAAANAAMFVEVGGVSGCQPGGDNFPVFVRENGTPADFGVRAMNFVCKSVQPGSHTINMQYSSLSSGLVTLGVRTMIVQYVK